MITTIIAVVALVLAVVAFITAIAMGAQTPYADVEMMARKVYEQKRIEDEQWHYKRQSDYSRGYNDAYSQVSKLMADEKYRARSLDEQERFAKELAKATKPIHQLEKDLGIKI